MRSFASCPTGLPRLVFVLLALASLVSADEAWAAGQKRALVLYSTRRDAQIVTLGERELPRILEDGLPEGLDYYSEYLDRGRFPDDAYQNAFRDFLKRKYTGLSFDVVIAMQDVAAEFVGRYRDELFPGTPVVFFADSSIPRLTNATGIMALQEFGDTLRLATALQPGVRHVFVVAGAAAGDKEFEAAARLQFQAFEPRLTFTYLTGLTTQALESRLSQLPANSIVYYVLVDEDGAGAKFHPLDYLDRVAAVANAPTYCWVDSAMGHGIVGGGLKDQGRQVEAVGRLAFRVLRGESAGSIPVTSPDLNVPQVDWRELSRWGINEAAVPAGTLIRFRDPSVWDRYRAYILSAVVLLLAQSALIVGLLVQRRRRRQAEELARDRETELRGSYERIRDLAGRLLNAQEVERARIARELHDDISQQLALLSIDLELLGGAAEAPARQMAAEALDRTQTLARSVHDLSHRLHPAKLRLIGLVAALQGLQHELARPGAAIVVTHENVPRNLPPDMTLCLFRIAQEGVQNALKHGRAQQVLVELRGGSDRLVLTIVDDGIGFDVDPALGTGLGLVSMDERIEAIGGTFAIHSRPGAGTRLEIVVPLRFADDKVTVAV
jgi:signal transduction histidine kinase